MNYLRALHAESPIERSELARAGLLNVAFALTSIVAPNAALRDRESPYRFTPQQMGRYGV